MQNYFWESYQMLQRNHQLNDTAVTINIIIYMSSGFESTRIYSYNRVITNYNET